ncbi:MAG: YicC family protein [Bacteroidales bacterium]|nr:YicC family protein [Bacteroidales bacterium]
MIKSMTGYGKSEFNYGKKRVVVEIRTLNGKQLDITTRIPNGYREKELEIRSLLGNALNRGKVDLTINIEDTGSAASFTLNRPLVERYYSELRSMAGQLGLEQTGDLLPVVMRMPEVLVPSRDEVTEEEWELLKNTIQEVAGKVDIFRTEEGNILLDDLLKRNQKLLDFLEKVRPYEKKRIDILKSKIKKDLIEIISPENIDHNRFEQELIYYIEKLDITEEKVRLRKHCDFFRKTISEGEAQGKKLIFITQEMGREINTLGSKSNDASIQKLVVMMKDELEKMKEQLFNIL